MNAFLRGGCVQPHSPMQRRAAFLLHLRLPRLVGDGGLFNELKVFYAKERRVE